MIVVIIGKDKSTQSPNLTPWLYAAYTLTFMYVDSLLLLSCGWFTCRQ